MRAQLIGVAFYDEWRGPGVRRRRGPRAGRRRAPDRTRAARRVPRLGMAHELRDVADIAIADVAAVAVVRGFGARVAIWSTRGQPVRGQFVGALGVAGATADPRSA